MMMRNKFITIGNRKVGDGYPVFIVAELSANHMHSFTIVVKTIKAMKEAGADAVKLQTYSADDVTLNVDNKYFRIKQGTVWDGKTLHQLYREAIMPWEWQPRIKKIAEKLGLIFFSTPTDKSGVDFLEKVGVGVYKIPSFEIINLPLIKYAASKGKPVIISTGIATRSEIQEAADACRKSGNSQIVLTKCTSSYPAPLEDVNLKMIPVLRRDFCCPVGLSDHTLSTSVAAASVALGACIIEKHFILNRNLGGPDATFSLEPQEFNEMVKAVREVEESLGDISYAFSDGVKRARRFCRSLFVVRDIKKGERFSEENVRFIRPRYGLGLRYLVKVLKKSATRDIQKGTPLTRRMIE